MRNGARTEVDRDVTTFHLDSDINLRTAAFSKILMFIRVWWGRHDFSPKVI